MSMTGDSASFPAEWMDGSTGGTRVVEVVPLADRLVLRSEQGIELQSWTLAELRVEPLSGGVLHLTHASAPGALLSASSPGLHDVLVTAGAAARPLQKRALLTRAALYATAVGAGIGIFLVTLPTLSSAIARRVPPGIEEQLAFPVHRFLENGYCRTDSSRGALDALVEPLRLAGDPEFGGARLEIVDFSMVNAFTLPGGSIVVTRGLVDNAEGPEELAGVLAHELEHVARRHVMGQVVRSAILTTGWRLTFGDFAGLMAIDPSTTLEIASRRFSRDAEREADDGAVRRLRHAGLSTRGLSAFFARIERQTDIVPEWLSTHPASATRRKLLADPTAEEFTKDALPPAQWSAIKEACAEADR